jgi:hypothetical protein
MKQAVLIRRTEVEDFPEGYGPLYIHRAQSLQFQSHLPVSKDSRKIKPWLTVEQLKTFVNYWTAIKLHIGEKKLSYPCQVFNIDGTSNQVGSVTFYCILQIYVGGKHVLQRFYIMNLGSDTFILGYPWLCHFNPCIDWAEGWIKDGAVQLETPWLALWMKMHQNLVVKQIQEHNELDLGDEILVVCKMHIAQEWAILLTKRKRLSQSKTYLRNTGNMLKYSLRKLQSVSHLHDLRTMLSS